MKSSIAAPSVFGWLAQAGRLDDAEMLRTFNCGIGMVAVASKGETEKVLSSLREAGVDVDLLALPPGDATKSLASAERIYDRLGEFKLARDGALVALGGGMVSDLTGFVAATWMPPL